MRDLWVILDANFLMVPENHGVDIFSELERILDKRYELIIPEAVVEELKNLEKNEAGAEKKAAGVALDLASEIKKVSSKKSGDKEIVRLAREGKCMVATNDSSLKKNLRSEGIPVIYLRQKSHLEIDGKL